jgi:hypothetical protein
VALTPFHLRPEWYTADRAAVQPMIDLGQVGVDFATTVPGIMLVGTKYRVHRSHLPLMVTEPEAARLLLPRPPSDWAARDVATQALGFTLRPWQHQAIDFIRRRRGTLLGDEMRVGKGNRHGTPVLTPTGWRPIEALCVGDQVIGANGRPCNVTGVFPRGEIPVFRVTFSDRTSTVVDGEHLWAAWARNNFHRGKPHEVVDTAHVRAKIKQQWRIPMVEPVAFSERALPLDPYLLGVLLGDGALSNSVEFVPGDEVVPAEVAKVLPPGVRLTRGAPVGGKATVWRITGLVHHSNSVLTALRELGLMGKRSWEKFVPEAYLFASPAQRLALLQGLMDTDGELSARRQAKASQLLQFSSSSEALVQAVKFLVESFGGSVRAGYRATPKYTYLGEQRTGRPSWRLTINMPPGVSPFRARQGWVPRAKFHPARIIRSVEPEGTAPVTCISVDAPDQLYVIEHGLVTHNTLSSIMSHEPASGPLVIICPAMVRPVWIGWLRQVFPDEPIGIFSGRTFDPRVLQHKLIIGHYEILPWWQADAPIGTLIFDEAHVLTNRAARRTKAAVFLASRAQRVIAATGTPIWNLPPNLWSVLGLVAPGAFGGYHEFAQRYGAPKLTAHGTQYTGISNEAELNLRLTEVMLRRRWADVATTLPAVTRDVVLVELTPAQRRKLDVLTLGLKGAGTIGMLARYREQLSTLKVEPTVTYAQSVLDRREPLVIWTWHVSLAEKIAAALGDRARLLTGDTPKGQRTEVLDEWKAAPALALVCTMSVAQVGLDFSHAHLAVFAEVDYTPAVVAQAEMRTYAPTRAMHLTYVVADHLVDQRVVVALARKLAAASPVGVDAAQASITFLQHALCGPVEEPDMDRLLAALLDA